MNYEERYNQALEIAKHYHDRDNIHFLEHIFPELKESEDERIRKELLEHCVNRRDGKQICVDASDYRRWAAWLEKQGEQLKELHEIIIKLWSMLDWIDTYADLKIDGSENDVYFSRIENKTKERFAFVKSDGYDLFINNEKITNNERNTTKTD